MPLSHSGLDQQLSTLNPLSSLVPRRGLGLNLFRVGLNSIPCICAVFAHILLKVPFSSLGQFAATAGLWLPIKESCIFISNLSSPCLRFPLFLFVLFFVIKVIESMDLVSKYPFLPFPFVKPAFLSKLLFHLPFHA